MNVRTLSLTLTLAALTGFALLNWGAFTAPTALTLGFAEFQAPLGMIMLVVTGLISALFLAYIVFQQAGVILDARRFAKDLNVSRELADKAEASRFTEMRSFLEGELRRLESQSAAGTREVNARLEQMQAQLEEKFAESTRVLSAYVGEVDDKLDRALPTPQP